MITNVQAWFIRYLKLILSVLLAILLSFVSISGIGNPHAYAMETDNWRLQAVGQDYVDLFLITPVLVIAAVYASQRRRAGEAVWLGSLVYLVYTFVIYCFDVRFNNLFLCYCAILGLSFYLLLFHAFRLIKSLSADKQLILDRVSGIYMIVIAVLFCGLWLKDIIPAALSDAVPQSVMDAGLPTNGVHVLDLSVVLPGVFITGVGLLRNVPVARVIAPVLLTFFVLMDLTIAVLTLMMGAHGLGGDPAVAFIMIILALLTFVLLFLHLRTSSVIP